MDIAEQVVRKVKATALVNEELHRDIRSLEGQVALQRQILSAAKTKADINSIKLDNQIGLGVEYGIREKQLASTREVLNAVVPNKVYLRKYIAMFEPTDEQQAFDYEQLRLGYEKLVAGYQDTPEYRRVIEAQKMTKKLDEDLSEARNQLMRLEAEEKQVLG